jgi:hypothetical protein
VVRSPDCCFCADTDSRPVPTVHSTDFLQHAHAL